MQTLQQTYHNYDKAFDFFNELLFDGQLQRCLITFQRKKGSRGYFSGDRFERRVDQDEIIDEIAMNPEHFRERSDAEILSTLVHEMVHLWQHHFGTPSRSGYHNREWATKMREVGLQPSTTGQPGGKQTGQRVTHYIIEHGRFETACYSLLNQIELRYVERDRPTNQTKRTSKTRYSCSSCGLNAWGKPGIRIMCEDCATQMNADA